MNKLISKYFDSNPSKTDEKTLSRALGQFKNYFWKKLLSLQSDFILLTDEDKKPVIVSLFFN